MRGCVTIQGGRQEAWTEGAAVRGCPVVASCRAGRELAADSASLGIVLVISRAYACTRTLHAPLCTPLHSHPNHHHLTHYPARTQEMLRQLLKAERTTEGTVWRMRTPAAADKS